MEVTWLLDTQTLILMLVVFLAGLSYFKSQLPDNFPKGPRPLPIIGNLLLLAKNPSKAHEVLAALTYKDGFGPIVGLKMGSHSAIILNRIDVLKETIIEQGEAFSARPKFFTFLKSVVYPKGEQCGIVFHNGLPWKASRRFSLMMMKDLGLGRNMVEEAIREEARMLCAEINKRAGQPQDMTVLLNMVTSNVISSITFGTRFDYSSQEYWDTLQHISRVAASPVFTSPLNFFPLLQSAVPKSWVGEGKKSMDVIRAFIQRQVDKHRKEFDSHNIRDFIDIFLDMEEKGEHSGITLDNMKQIIVEMFVTGTETSSTTLKWLFLYLIRHPDVQVRCQQEVDSVVGQSREPSLADKNNFHFLMATLHETMRHSTLAPLAVPHATQENVTIRGYNIPKGTLVLINIYAMHNDPEQWANPSAYCPERWLDNKGHLQKRESFVPFSSGPRVCLGESLARNELFLFFAFLMQRFRFEPVDASNLPSMEPVVGSVMAPLPYQLIIKAR